MFPEPSAPTVLPPDVPYCHVGTPASVNGCDHEPPDCRRYTSSEPVASYAHLTPTQASTHDPTGIGNSDDAISLFHCDEVMSPPCRMNTNSDPRNPRLTGASIGPKQSCSRLVQSVNVYGARSWIES